MIRRAASVVAAVCGLSVALSAQGVAPDYRVKAAFLYNFVKFVEWPAPSTTAPLVICVAGRRVFDTLLEDLVRGEVVNGRPVTTRTILEPDAGCDVVFVPDGAAFGAYLRAARGRPVLTVGETEAFIAQGGIVRFYLDGRNVRFEINPAAADQAGLRISSRLLQLARITGGRGATR